MVNHGNWRHVEAGYMQGGVGYALSRAALRAFIEEGLNTSTCNEILSHANQDDASSEDVEIAGCFAKLNVLPSDSRDAVGKQRFLTQSASSYLALEYVYRTYWWPVGQVCYNGQPGDK